MTNNNISILHHGATVGVTGSCHELIYQPDKSILIDCGLFQGSDHSSHGKDSANANRLEIDFDISTVQALIATHAHIDHIGRIPYLFAKGFSGNIYCSLATAEIIPLMLTDALKIGFTRDKYLIKRVLSKITGHIVALNYGLWHSVDDYLTIKLKPAGHILGSAYVECDSKQVGKKKKHRTVFSGDLGAPYAPLLPSPKSPYACDTLVLESTYGDKNHSGRKSRSLYLKQVIEKCVEDQGAILIPAFSLGRTQDILYEFEQIIHQYGKNQKTWKDIEIIIDSPLAHRFTKVYRNLKFLWDKEAKRKIKSGRHPLNFEQMLTIDKNKTHLSTVEYLKKTARPVIVISASGMCSGGRIVNYLKALIEDKRTDIIFCGYQAQGTTGRAIQHYGNKKKYPQGWVEIDGNRYEIRAEVHTMSGYSAHAGQADLLNFIKRMRYKPSQIRLLHGDAISKQILADKVKQLVPKAEIVIP